jgi:hypothetical protein
MTLVRAPQLGIERFATDRDKEVRTNASAEDKDTILRAVYRQVLGQQHLMASERLLGAESLFRDGYLSVRELVRTIARSGLYRAKFFENCNAYRFIELNHKHLLGRAPHNREEMLHHFTILQEQGVDAEIDSYIDSAEYQRRFGENTVHYLHGWDYAVGHEGRQFSWLMQLARGAAASTKGDRTGKQAALNRSLHQNRAVSVSGSAPAVRITYAAPPTDYRFISTDGPFRAGVAEATPACRDLAVNRRLAEDVGHLAAQAQGLLIDDEQVGIVGLGGVADDRGADRQSLGNVDMQVQRRVVAVAQLDHPGHAHEIHPRLEIEGAGDLRSRDDEDVNALEVLRQRMRDRSAATKVPKAERVMAVHEDADFVQPRGAHPSGIPECGKRNRLQQRTAWPLFRHRGSVAPPSALRSLYHKFHTWNALALPHGYPRSRSSASQKVLFRRTPISSAGSSHADEGLESDPEKRC